MVKYACHQKTDLCYRKIKPITVPIPNSVFVFLYLFEGTDIICECYLCKRQKCNIGIDPGKCCRRVEMEEYYVMVGKPVVFCLSRKASENAELTFSKLYIQNSKNRSSKIVICPR